MVLDTSAIICIIRHEPEADAVLEAIHKGGVRMMSLVSLVETSIVLEKQFGRLGSRELEQVISDLDIMIEPVTNAQGSAAILAFWRFGKGIHPAGLNFGDCFSYALARTTGEPLLFKGNDFSRTDIPAVLY